MRIDRALCEVCVTWYNVVSCCHITLLPAAAAAVAVAVRRVRRHGVMKLFSLAVALMTSVHCTSRTSGHDTRLYWCICVRCPSLWGCIYSGHSGLCSVAAACRDTALIVQDTHNVADGGVLQAMWEELVGKVLYTVINSLSADHVYLITLF